MFKNVTEANFALRPSHVFIRLLSAIADARQHWLRAYFLSFVSDEL